MAATVRQEARPATDEISEVAPGIVRMQLPIKLPGLGHVNCYALEDENGFALVDPGLPGEEPWNALVERLGQAGIPMARIHSVIVTHSHPDHFGGAARLREASGADVVSHKSFRLMWQVDDDGPDPQQLADGAAEGEAEGALKRFMSPMGRKQPWGGMYQPMGNAEQEQMRSRMNDPRAVPTPTRKLEDAQVVRFARRDWVAVHTPGHTPDHLCLYDPIEGVVLSGDHVLPTITPHISGFGNVDNPLDEFLASLDRMDTLEGVRCVLPAHGDPFTNLSDRVDHIRRHHVERLQRLLDASKALGRRASVNELMQHLFSERAWGSMAESETFAHLEHLRLQGLTDSAWHDDLLWYTLTPAGIVAATASHDTEA